MGETLGVFNVMSYDEFMDKYVNLEPEAVEPPTPVEIGTEPMMVFTNMPSPPSELQCILDMLPADGSAVVR